MKCLQQKLSWIEKPEDHEVSVSWKCLTTRKELNQAEYDGKVINVNVAKPRTDRPAGGRGGFNRNGGGRDRRSNGGGRSFEKRF